MLAGSAPTIRHIAIVLNGDMVILSRFLPAV
jgi:hypothetical protein